MFSEEKKAFNNREPSVLMMLKLTYLENNIR